MRAATRTATAAVIRSRSPARSARSRRWPRRRRTPGSRRTAPPPTSSACRRASCSACPIWSPGGTPTPARRAPAAATGPMHLTDVRRRPRGPTTARRTSRTRRGRPADRPDTVDRGEPEPRPRGDADRARPGDAAHRPAAQHPGGAALLGRMRAREPGRLVRRGGPATPVSARPTRRSLRRRGVRDDRATGAARITDDGQRVRARRRARSTRTAAGSTGSACAGSARPDGLECPRRHRLRVDPGAVRADGPATDDYGNHDLGNRPQAQKIEYIVIHDTEGYWARPCSWCRTRPT